VVYCVSLMVHACVVTCVQHFQGRRPDSLAFSVLHYFTVTFGVGRCRSTAKHCLKCRFLKSPCWAVIYPKSSYVRYHQATELPVTTVCCDLQRKANYLPASEGHICKVETKRRSQPGSTTATGAGQYSESLSDLSKSCR
jgi:hypothetical protein